MLSTPLRKIIFRQTGLRRPWVTPALQAGHVANVNTRICAISNGPLTPIDLLGNTYVGEGGANGRATQPMPTIGPSVTNTGNTAGWKITGLTVETPTSITCAAIVFLMGGQAGASLPTICTNSSSTGGTGGVYFGPFGASGTVGMQSIGPGTFKNSSFKLQYDNRPYFIAGTVDGSVSSFVAADLSTGQIQSSAGTGLTFAANDGTYCYGGTNTLHMNGNYLAAAMMSNADLTLAQLQAWAKNPWSFWYPV
jgi:hypothetical protein